MLRDTAPQRAALALHTRATHSVRSPCTACIALEPRALPQRDGPGARYPISCLDGRLYHWLIGSIYIYCGARSTIHPACLARSFAHPRLGTLYIIGAFLLFFVRAGLAVGCTYVGSAGDTAYAHTYIEHFSASRSGLSANPAVTG